MPFHLKPNRSTKATVYPLIDQDKALRNAFLGPIWRGEKVDKDILNRKPDPYVVECAKGQDISPIWGGAVFPWHIDEEVRNLIEGLEPGRHNFIPIRVRLKDAMTDERPFYLLHVTTALRGSIIIEKTRFADGIGKTDITGGGQLSASGPIVLKSSMIEGHHLWRGGIGKYGGGGDPFAFDYFCSDEFFERMKPHKKALVEFHRCEVK